MLRLTLTLTLTPRAACVIAISKFTFNFIGSRKQQLKSSAQDDSPARRIFIRVTVSYFFLHNAA